jgi:WD40 repeat protein
MDWIEPGNELLCGAEDGSLFLVDEKGGLRSKEFGSMGGPVRRVVRSADGKLVAIIVNHTVHVWGTDANGEGQIGHVMFFKHNLQIYCAAFSRDSTRLAVGTRDAKVLVWNLNTKQQSKFSAPGDVRAITFAPRENLLCTAGRDQKVTLWNAETFEPLATLAGHQAIIECIAISPDGSLLASGSRDRTIRLWSLQDRRCLLTLEGHSQTVNNLDFSPDGSTLASAGQDHTVRLWDVQSGNPQLVLEGHPSPVRDVAFSLDGCTLASCCEEGIIKFWETTR